MRSCRAFAPATVANVASGFDIFGFALQAPGDEVEVRFAAKAQQQVTIISIEGDGGRLPLQAEKNSAGVSVQALLNFLQLKDAIEIIIEKKMPLGSGLGSSAASAAAAIWALNGLLGAALTPKQLVPFAMEGERVCCGAAHADNVAAALLGGFVLIRSYEPLDLVKIDCNMPLYCVVVHPHIEILTKTAREILPKSITLSQHVRQSGNAAALVAALLQGDPLLLSRALQDEIVEPVRAALIPGFYGIKKAAIAAGALGCSISGSGPSIFALASNLEALSDASAAIASTCHQLQISYTLYHSSVNTQGCKFL